MKWLLSIKNLPYLLIIVGLIISLAIKTCQPPREDHETKTLIALQDTIRQTRSQIDLLSNTIDSLLKVREKDGLKSKSRQGAFTREISGWKEKAKEQRGLIDSLIQRHPPFVELLAVQDTIISRQATEITHLQEDLRVSEQTSLELTNAYQAQQRLNERITGEFEAITSLQAQKITGLEKKVRRHKVLGWVAVGVGFIGGVLIAK